MPGVTIPHLAHLGDDRPLVGGTLKDSVHWDALRMSTNGAFALPESRSAWEAAADGEPAIGERMAAVGEICRQLGAKSLASYGVGTALPELWLHRWQPHLQLQLGDYAPLTVRRLAELFPEARVLHHDLAADPPLTADVHLLHRVDTEFRDRTWRRVFRRFAAEAVVVVATEVLSAERVRSELRQYRQRRHDGWTHAGWIRTRGAFESLWRRTHHAEALVFGDLHGWLLTPRH